MKLLLGVGAGDDAGAALEAVVGRAREAGDDLTVAVYAGDGTGDDVDAVARRVRDHLDDLGFEARVERVEGDPGSQLVELADAGDYDRLVIPGGTRSPMGKVRLSNAAEFVLLNARCSVTLLR
ncbi:MAG: universal stress protein [Haloarculaceae archaeon]